MSSASGPIEPPRPARKRLAVLGWVVLLAGFVACQLLVHRIVSADPRNIVAELLSVAPLLLVAAWFVGRSRFGLAGSFVLLVLGVGGCMLWNRSGADGILLLPQPGIYLLLLCWFGRSLRPQSEPLVTVMARHVHGTLSTELAVYTRRVTVAWCVFFFSMALTSAALFVWTSIETWSLFANLLNLPLVVAMFAAEFLWRVLRHPEFSTTTVPAMIRAFRDFDSSQGPARGG